LQTREIERVGGVKTLNLDIRIIAATNRNLEDMVKEGKFREDLWFRLNVFPIWIPPLRDRISDLPALLQHFINLKAKELKLSSIPAVKPGEIDKLMNYNWPGNVRELQNVVERALIINPQGQISFSHLNISDKVSSSEEKLIPDTYNLDEVNFNHIKNVLQLTNGKIHGNGGAAELMGINANTLRNKMNRLGIEYKKR
jgi:DNA-binding NtrC family response regulator